MLDALLSFDIDSVTPPRTPVYRFRVAIFQHADSSSKRTPPSPPLLFDSD